MHLTSTPLRKTRCLFPLFYKIQFVNSSGQVQGKNMEDLKSLVYIDKTPYTAVTEGKAEVLFPSSHDVFYNPVQEFNRDLSIALLKQFLKESATLKNGQKVKSPEDLPDVKQTENIPHIRILEALAASGLRSIRIAKEVSGSFKITANDRDKQAFTSIERNIKHNKVEDIVEASNDDASLLMYKNRQYKDRFDVIDLDPYGTAAPFLNAAVQSIADGGMLMITCTDMAILCGNGIEACHAKYGAVSTKIASCHEMALRIVLQCIESHANTYGRYIEPILSLSVDFYVRLFVRVYTSPIKVKQSVCKLSMVYICSGCGSFHLQPLASKIKTDNGGEKFTPSTSPPVSMVCNNCGSKHKMCGPVWSDNLHSREFIQKTLQAIEEEKNLYNTSKRLLGILNVVLEELEECPLYHKVERLSSTLHVVSPTNIQIRSAILNAGYKVSISHTSPTSVKTDAPLDVIWDIMRAWAKQNPGKKTLEKEPSKTIMSHEPKIEVSFETHPDADPQSRSAHLLRFQINPTPNWGPKCRSTTSLLKSKEEEKRLRCQNKRQKRENECVEEEKDHKKIKTNHDDPKLAECEEELTDTDIDSKTPEELHEDEEVKEEEIKVGGCSVDKTLMCRTVRFGSFKIVPEAINKNVNIHLSTDGLSLYAPMTSDDQKFVKITIKPCDITRMYLHFGDNLPIIFISSTGSFGEAVRKSLDMCNADQKFYDPVSDDKTVKFLVFLINIVTEDQCEFLRHSFLNEEKVKEIDWNLANELLVLSTGPRGHLDHLFALREQREVVEEESDEEEGDEEEDEEEEVEDEEVEEEEKGKKGCGCAFNRDC